VVDIYPNVSEIKGFQHGKCNNEILTPLL